MSDNKKTADNNVEQAAEEQASNTASQQQETPSASSLSNNRKTLNTGKHSASNKISKTAVLALLIALASATGIGAIHYLHTKQNANLGQQILLQADLKNQQTIAQFQQLLSEQQATNQQLIASAVAELTTSSQTHIQQLEQQISRFEQNQPSDWLIHEAEYLTRIAARTLWLEHNTRAAINLLTDADKRIKELNDPQYLPLRQLIRQDIETLSLMPTLDTEEVILELLALNKQIPQLSLAMAKVPSSQNTEEDLQLTEDTADWQSNLAKTWHKFLADFITVRRRTGQVEALMTPEQQQNLRENLSLKLQQLQWAAAKENTPVFQQYLNEVESWLTEYFDLGHLATAKFYQAIQLLKDKVISFDNSVSLSSHRAIRKILNSKNMPVAKPAKAIESEQKQSIPQESMPVPAPEENSAIDENLQIQQPTLNNEEA